MSYFIEEYAIQFHKGNVNREEAIIIASKPLIDKNQITEEYVKSMIAVLDQYGTYMVISKGIAIAHAKPSEFVLENSLALTIFEEPVKFGHPTNDPVKLLFVLAAKENEGHMEGLQKLAIKMLQTDFYEHISSATTTKEVVNYLSK